MEMANPPTCVRFLVHASPDMLQNNSLTKDVSYWGCQGKDRSREWGQGCVSVLVGSPAPQSCNNAEFGINVF